ncbi:tripartite tricarboxylate transporter TctA [Actinoplanes sp. NBRC 14428]|uniref:Putative tricarboxylic transport membrane protein n=1 Tax=Pseudosporangium ferrugineum TaxID=439699 RepID=A0A2T0SFB5_9ACTN|nr:tripartite tricarboxylate transporter permease [Pseudosporangium ferrugineum]PRY32108.1 putative tricarboxylic transport membrane protein [Pseudosporangium ferrugineum]BCJ49651.1 tripartite tricarboxylate transporter TctA [Actinoplanes sp. NBRC 14428]
MNVLGDLLSGFGTVLSPEYLLYAAIGVTLGTFVGVLPGIGPALTIALLLPVTFSLDDPIGTFIMFAGIYYGAMYGGSTTSILLNTPGESASVATAIEGHQMARRGRAKAALATAAIGSFVAGTISTLLLSIFAQPVAKLATTFRAADYFALSLVAMVAVTALVGRSLLRGLLSLVLGLFLGLVGIDALTGQARFTFGTMELLEGIDIVVVIVGLFAIGETLYVASRLGALPEHVEPLEPGTAHGWMTRDDWRRSWAPWLRGTALGFPFGALPSGGADVPTFLSYTYEKHRAKNREEFGRGAIEGVAGPEAANNAAFSGVLVPLLTLGIPTSATAAVMLAAFQIFNLQPGPQLFDNSPELVWALIASLYVGNVLLLALNLPLIRIWVKVLQIPRPILYAGILVFATLGVYASTGSVNQVFIAYAVGVVGFGMRHFDFPIAPVILGLILGPMMEVQFRRALLVSDGDLSVFVTRPLTVGMLLLAVVAVLVPYLPRIVARLRGRRAGDEPRKLTFAEED